ncbi:hypothetical protein TTHERM_00813090 (macronuclear) [Tetrahymena thermophila SB210]|uniref:Transmembrane protein n=1 Tax=Tetrahymena thermophila (strain SB210) TaxID=312017 RepID=Q22SS2_TETTS|nr:hypothetical protein TTHERM_00813090 [Tetrahymena thermophila SB210]EAR88392.3 hypothetical protein TTHERM_00813090 [Tetrahymena thermophila SB210]|eukprot:XP_001008637.3 hypothetical protein TTHERM_00813090 [Tetrahymena thermophila SB210]
MLIKLAIIKSYIVLLVIQLIAKAQNTCVEGCSSCSNSNNQNICTKCLDGYQLDSNNNLCVYTKCSSNLFYDRNIHDIGNIDNECVAICSPFSYKNYQNNLCQSKLQCSIQKPSQLFMKDNTITKDFFIYQDNYYVIQKENYLSVYDRNDLNLVKSNDNSISYWDIKNESRNSKTYLKNISFNQFTEIASIDNHYGLIYNIYSQKESEFQIFYDQLNQVFSQSNSFKLNVNAQKIKFIDQWMFIQNLNSIIVYKIIVTNNNDSLNLQIENHFTFKSQQNKNYFDTLSISQFGIYVLVQDDSASLVNLNDNSFQPVQIQMNDQQEIQKGRIFQASDTDLNTYLIIQSEQQLIYTNLQTNSSNIIQEIDSLTDFEVCDFMDKEKKIVVLDSNINLSFFYFDQNQKEFIESTQKFTLKYNTNYLYLVKYQNQISPQKEFVYELIALNNDYIQIVKKSDSLIKHEKQLIQINLIINFNLAFPSVDYSIISKIVLSYQPPIAIQLNQQGGINFYDYSQETKCVLQKQLKLGFSFGFKSIQKFYNDKIIIYDNKGYIIDIYKKNILNVFKAQNQQYTTNNDMLAMIFQDCLIIQSSNLQNVFKNCQIDFISRDINIYLNKDLKIMAQNEYEEKVSVYQINLKDQTIQLLNTINNITYFQIIKKFYSLTDKINNNFSLEQILTIDENNNFRIYDFSLSLIYEMKSLTITGVTTIYLVVNDNQMYVLEGNQGILFINITDNSSCIIQLGYKLGQTEFQKKVNEYGKTYYWAYVMQATQMFEYAFDLQKQIVIETGFYYFNTISYLSVYVQNLKSTTQMSTYQNEDFDKVLSSYVQKYKRYQFTSRMVYQQSLYSQKFGKLFVIFDSKLVSFDIYTGSQEILSTLEASIYDVSMKLYDEFLLYYSSEYENYFIILINLSTNEKFLKKLEHAIKNIFYSKDDNLIYLYNNIQFDILDTKLIFVQSIFNDFQLKNINLECFAFKYQISCLSQSSTTSNNSFLLVYDKVFKVSKKVKFEDSQFTVSLFDEQYNHIYIYSSDHQNLKIYATDGILIQTVNNIQQGCLFFTSKAVCRSQKSLIIVDKNTLALNEYQFEKMDSNAFQQMVYIDYLNYLLIQNPLGKQISVYDISAQRYIFDIQVKQNEVNNNYISFFEFYENLSNYVIFLDQMGTLYISSLRNKPSFQTYINVIQDFQREKGFRIIQYDSLSNDIYLNYDGYIYKLDLNQLGIERDPQLNEPYTLYTQIQRDNQQTDYLILSQDSLIFRYSQQKIKFELSILMSSRILDIKYNQSDDVLTLGLENSILFYQQYQSCKNSNTDPDIYQLDNIQFQQFIIDSIVITSDQKILHLDLKAGVITKTIQFNLTQTVTQFNVNKKQDLIIVGFSDGQVLQYNLTSQDYFLYDTIKEVSLKISIIVIQLIEISDSKLLAYIVSNGALLLQIDVLKQQVIKQIDLRSLVDEDPSISLSKFLIDQNYQRYLFCFNGQKKVYIWNYSKNEQERNLSLPKMESNLRIEQNFLIIQCIFQINLYQLNKKIEFVASIKKDFTQDSILDFKLFNNKTIAIFLIDRFELFIINGDKFNMITQISYQYSRLLNYSIDSQKNVLSILGLHQAGVFENKYNLDIYKSETVSECFFFSSSKEYQNIIEEQTYVAPKQKEIQTINGVSLVNQENQFIYFYLQIPSDNIQNLFLQTSSISNSQQVMAPYDIQNNFIALQNTTFQNLSQSTLQFTNFSLTFQNSTNLFINITQNKKTQQVIFQNMAIDFECFGSLLLIKSNEVIIEKGYFKFNTAQNGGAIYFQSILKKIEFKKSLFQQNTAKSSGGALFLENIANCLVLFDSQTIIKNNRAFIGGGLRIVQTDQKKLLLPQNFPFSKNIFDNVAEIYGDDSTSYLQNIIIQNNDYTNEELFIFYKDQSNVPKKFQNDFSRYAEMRQFRSGGLINFKMYIVDEQNRYLSFSKDKLEQAKFQ